MTEVVVIMTIPNLHLISIFEELINQSDFNVRYHCWGELPSYRKSNDWKLPDRVIYSVDDQDSIKKIKKADIVVFLGAASPFPKQPFLLRKMLKLKERVYVISEGVKKQPGLLKRIVFRSLINSKKLTYLAIGHHSHKDFRQLGMSKWEMRKFGFSEQYRQVEPINKSSKDVVKIISAGQLIDRKNYNGLLKAIAAYNGDQNFSVQIAGEGEKRNELVELAHRLNISDKVDFIGHLKQGELHDLFLHADAFILPSHYDGWGVVINQCLHYSLPVIISNGVRSGKDYLVENENNGLIFENQDEFNHALKRILEDADLRKSLSENAKVKYDEWKISNIAARLKQIFDDPTTDFNDGPLSIIKE